MSVEKISQDLYDKDGKVNARLIQFEKNIQEINSRFQQLEIYTGLGENPNPIEELSSTSHLKGKDFR